MMALRLFPYQPVRSLIRSPLLGAVGTVSLPHDQVRTFVNNKHKDFKFKNLRRLKVGSPYPIKYNGRMDQAAKDGMALVMPNIKKLWKERELYVTGSNQIVEEFVPPENQGKAITEEIKKKWNSIGGYGKDKMALRKIRGYESEFNLKVFQEEAKEVYIKAHECLAANDHEALSEYVTEHARIAMLFNSSQRTIRWKYLESLEDPKVVQIRTFQLDENNNMFAQITVRMMSQQCLAVYDRFGRLLYGSEVLAKDVLEYAVYEKHLSNEYGVWRLHDKIIPNDLIRMAEHTFVAPKDLPQETSAVVPAITSNEAEVKAN